LICDGRAISRNAYIALWNVIDDIWGPGNSSSTFNIPDLRGAYLRNIGTAILDANNVGPTAVGDSQSDQNADHTHTMATDGSHHHSGPTGAHGFTAQNQRFFVVKDSPHNGGSYRIDAAGDHTHTIYNEGGTEARVYNYGIQYCIRY
jgi:microcystin-dependent protein